MKLTAKDKWTKLITEQQESGLTVAQFCRDNSLNSKSFYNWRIKITTLSEALSFVKVQSASAPVPISKNSIQLHFSNTSLSLPGTVSPVWVAAL
uniref:IS66 family insertion sequence element accessory protein TnpA n=3 Tax=Psychromonas ossibalaenae TaxID=444922 RepID=UPI0003815C82